MTARNLAGWCVLAAVLVIVMFTLWAAGGWGAVLIVGGATGFAVALVWAIDAVTD